MPSFDIVSEINMQEVDNAINQAQKEVGGRYDFKGQNFTIAFDKAKAEIKLQAEDEGKVNALLEVTGQKLTKRGIELGSVEYGKVIATGGKTLTQILKIKQGLETDQAKSITRLIKDSKLKVDTQIQDKQIRVQGKKIDDLQEVIALLKQNKDTVKVPLQFINMRS